MKIKNILIYILFQTYCVLLRETARGTVEGELSGGEAAKRKRSGKPPYSPKKPSEQTGKTEYTQYIHNKKGI